MIQYNMLNIKSSNSQLNKLKSATKNETKVTLSLSSNLIKNSNDETNFSHKLFTQASKIPKAFANGSTAKITFSKTQLSKIVQYGGFIPSISILGSPATSNLPMAPIKVFFSLAYSTAKES